VPLADALDRLEVLLERERLAIRAVDAESVLGIADEKLAVLAELEAADWADDRSAIERFRGLVPRLRENGVLLAHARNAARDLVQTLTHARPATYGASGALAGERTGGRLAVDV
jgi:hypothetical protein